MSLYLHCYSVNQHLFINGKHPTKVSLCRVLCKDFYIESLTSLSFDSAGYSSGWCVLWCEGAVRSREQTRPGQGRRRDSACCADWQGAADSKEKRIRFLLIVQFSIILLSTNIYTNTQSQYFMCDLLYVTISVYMIHSWTCSGCRCWLKAGPRLWTVSWGRESTYSVFILTVCWMVRCDFMYLRKRHS